VPSIASVPLGEPGTVLDDGIVSGYVDAAVGVLGGGPRELTIAYTPLHGVGGAVAAEAFDRAGFRTVRVVSEQAEPNPAFPTVPFPNPEEPGAVDMLLDLARRSDADIAIASDPDADRCAVGVPDAEGRWRMLHGDEVGILLADHLIRRGAPGTYATTIVSSEMLRALCERRGVPYGETLTGFKWIVRAAADDLRYGYEEALGYCVAPGHVRDKDGITAALLVAELAAGLKADLRTLADRLDELAAEFGVYATDQISVRVKELSAIDAAMGRLRAHPPASLLDQAVTSFEDLAPGADVVVIRTGFSRVVVRPSGTEPKLKAYLEIVEPVRVAPTTAAGAGRRRGVEEVAGARERAAGGLASLRAEVSLALGL
jgi:phosphomannomutase